MAPGEHKTTTKTPFKEPRDTPEKPVPCVGRGEYVLMLGEDESTGNCGVSFTEDRISGDAHGAEI